MTITKRFVADFKDVLAVRLTCPCGASVSLPPTSPWNLPRTCPHCHNEWIPLNSVDSGLLETLLRNISAMREVKDNAPWKAQLEFDLPESTSQTPS